MTDGENINTGAKNGLWALCDEGRSQSSSDLPLLKIWCAGHRINLAWKSVTKTVSEVEKLINDASSLSSYLHMSAVRTRNLKKLADEHSYQLCHFPRYFDVRWTQLTYQLLECVLKNWRVSAKYFEDCADDDREAKGFLAKWADKGTLHLTCFVADFLYVYKKFYQSFEDDNILIFDIPKKKNILVARLDEMKRKPLAGGWVENFLSNLVAVNNGDEAIYKFFDVALRNKQRRGSHNKLVSDRGGFDAIRYEVILSSINFLEERLDDEFSENTKSIRVLKELDATAMDQELRKCHQVICPDLSLRDFVMEYMEATEVDVC